MNLRISGSVGLTIKLSHYYVKRGRVAVNWVVPNNLTPRSMCLLSFRGFAMNRYSHCIVYLQGWECLSSLIESIGSAVDWLLTIDKLTLFNGVCSDRFGKEGVFDLNVCVTDKLKVVFTYTFKDQTPYTSCLSEGAAGGFKFQLEVSELIEMADLLMDKHLAEIDGEVVSDNECWAMPIVPKNIGLVDRGVGRESLAVRAAMFDDMRKTVRHMSSDVFCNTWLSLLNSVNEDVVCVCKTCGNSFARAKCWQKECFGCHNGEDSTGVNIDDANDVMLYFGGSHLYKPDGNR